MNGSVRLPDAADKCPDFEVLSSYFDGEHKLDAKALEHIKVCEKCSKTLADFAQMSKSFKSTLCSSEREEVVMRVKAGVHDKLKRELQAPPAKTTIDFPYWISSAAAALAVCALGVYMITHMEHPSSPDRQIAASVENVDPRPTASPSALVDAGLVASAPVQARPVAPLNVGSSSDSFGAIDLKQLSSVSFGGDDGARMIAGAVDNAPSRPAMIEPVVRHVWMVQGGSDLSARLNAISSALSLNSKGLSATADAKGEYNLALDLTRRQAVAFVRALKSSGYELLSPQAPQPEQSVFSGDGAEPVTYEASFIFKH